MTICSGVKWTRMHKSSALFSRYPQTSSLTLISVTSNILFLLVKRVNFVTKLSEVPHASKAKREEHQIQMAEVQVQCLQGYHFVAGFFLFDVVEPVMPVLPVLPISAILWTFCEHKSRLCLLWYRNYYCSFRN